MGKDGRHLGPIEGGQNVYSNAENIFAKSQCWPKQIDLSMPRYMPEEEEEEGQVGTKWQATRANWRKQKCVF